MKYFLVILLPLGGDGSCKRKENVAGWILNFNESILVYIFIFFCSVKPIIENNHLMLSIITDGF